MNKLIFIDDTYSNMKEYLESILFTLKSKNINRTVIIHFIYIHDKENQEKIKNNIRTDIDNHLMNRGEINYELNIEVCNYKRMENNDVNLENDEIINYVNNITGNKYILLDLQLNKTDENFIENENQLIYSNLLYHYLYNMYDVCAFTVFSEATFFQNWMKIHHDFFGDKIEKLSKSKLTYDKLDSSAVLKILNIDDEDEG